MARTKTQLKTKEPVKLRQKQLANGNISLYLDTYQNGQRHYEFLKLYVIPGTDAATRAKNVATIKAAEAIKAQRIIDIANGKANIFDKSIIANVDFITWLTAYMDKRERDGLTWVANMRSTIQVVRDFQNGHTLRLKDVTEDWCKRFVAYLRNERKARSGEIGLKENTVRLHVSVISTALSKAVKAKEMQYNPFAAMEMGTHSREAQSVVYLTQSEIKQLANTPLKNEGVKRAFLFACFCGLRVSDIRKLTWRDIQTDGVKKFIEVIQTKTKEFNHVPLSDEAQKWMPERAKGAADSDHVFNLVEQSRVNRILKQWQKAAGLSKSLHFHVSRHTFATLLLTKGADLYTVSKLLGHTNIETTQIYAKIVDNKKAAAVNLLNNMFND